MLPLIGLVLFLVLLALSRRRWRRRVQSAAADGPEPEEVNGRREGTSGPAARGGGGTRRMRRRSAAAAAHVSDDDADEEESEEENQDDGYYVAKRAKKKDVKKQERAARRQAEAVARDARKEKADSYAEMRRKRDEERDAEELRKEEEARALKAKQEAAANEDFEKWKGAFSVDTEGTMVDEEAETQGLLNNFVDYIKEQKCVGLEDLAAEFKMNSLDCINRIRELEQIGRLSGVMDDRGKFIYISPEEMKAVADYIKQMGRVSIAHLAKKSNEFIDLQPKAANMGVPSAGVHADDSESAPQA